MFKLKNPLPRSLRDDRRLFNFYRDFNLVPYAGATNGSAHMLLRILYDLYDLSASNGVCIDRKIEWAFDGEMNVSFAPIEGLSLNSEDVGDAQAIEFARTSREYGIGIEKIIDTTKDADRNLELTGTAALLIREAEVGGSFGYDVESLHPYNWMFHQTDARKADRVVVGDSLLFFANRLDVDPPRMVKVFPEWTEREGYRESVLIVKNKRDHSKYYGKPKSMPSIWWQFVEWQVANHTGKVTSTDLVSLVLLLMEKAEQNIRNRDGGSGGGREAVSALRQIMTQNGDYEEAQAMGVIEYPHGGKPPEAVKMDISRDYRWLDTVTSRASDYIYASHNWSKVVAGFSRASSGIGSDLLINEFLVCNTRAIKPKQSLWERTWKVIMDHVFDQNRREPMKEFQFNFEDRISTLVESLRPGSSNVEINEPDPAE